MNATNVLFVIALVAIGFADRLKGLACLFNCRNSCGWQFRSKQVCALFAF
jgi:hypothetical protein